MKPVFILLMVASLTAAPARGRQSRFQPQPDPASPLEIPYTRYWTLDKFNRRITFYISEDPAQSGDSAQRLPIVVVVLGSGPFSNFRREGDRIVDAHGTVRRFFAGKARVMAVEKPAVDFLQQPDPHDKNGFRGSVEFQAENTLPRWVEAVSAALRAARKLPQVDRTKTLIIGHSEGALVAALVARKHSFVTHVASLAGTGPPLEWELERKAGEGRLYPELPAEGALQLQRLKQDLEAIRRDPGSTDKVAIGHTHIYWASRLIPSAMKILSRTRARVFLAHGTADRNVSFENFQLMYRELHKHGRDVTEMAVQAADHGFQIAPTDVQPARDAWPEVIQSISNWFLSSR
jgi:predicted esterase